jgi:hypothetical protein
MSLYLYHVDKSLFFRLMNMVACQLKLAVFHKDTDLGGYSQITGGTRAGTISDLKNLIDFQIRIVIHDFSEKVNELTDLLLLHSSFVKVLRCKDAEQALNITCSVLKNRDQGNTVPRQYDFLVSKQCDRLQNFFFSIERLHPPMKDTLQYNKVHVNMTQSNNSIRVETQTQNNFSLSDGEAFFEKDAKTTPPMFVMRWLSPATWIRYKGMLYEGFSDTTS